MTFFPQLPFPRKNEIERVHLMVPTLFYLLFISACKAVLWMEGDNLYDRVSGIKGFCFLLQQPLRETISEAKRQIFYCIKSLKCNLKNLLVPQYSLLQKSRNKRHILVYNVTANIKSFVTFMFLAFLSKCLRLPISFQICAAFLTFLLFPPLTSTNYLYATHS